MNIDEVDKVIAEHLRATFTDVEVAECADGFARNGFVNFTSGRLIPQGLAESVDGEVSRLLAEHAQRRDLVLSTTGNTPRRMSVVRSEQIEESSELIRTIARSTVLLAFMSRIAREPVLAEVSADERFLITHQEQMTDTHGWHWGDYSFALIWALRMPPVEYGGMLQCVPHTQWDKDAPRINEILCERQIDTHRLGSGDIYFLRTDTTLHRTVPLSTDTQRTILNMTWAGPRDLGKELTGDDRWWENASVSAARAADGQ
jgi:hypothetical protein